MATPSVRPFCLAANQDHCAELKCQLPGAVTFWTTRPAVPPRAKATRGLKEGLTEEERYAVADHVVAQLKERGDPWRLNEEAATARPLST